MKDPKSSSATDIVYLDYSNSSVEFGITPDTTLPDSLFSIMKNNTIIISVENLDENENLRQLFEKPNKQINRTP